MTVHRICFFGDSVTIGTGDDACRGWPSYLCEAETVRRGHDLTCYNLGIRAETSQDIARRWQMESAPRLPGHVSGRLVFMFGLNDCADFNGTGTRIPLEASITTARAMLAAAKTDRPVLWIGMTPVRLDPPRIEPGPGVCYTFDRARTEALNRAYLNMAGDLDIPYLDLHAALADDPDWDAVLAAGDGVHPTDAGHRRLADIIADWSAWRKWL